MLSQEATQVLGYLIWYDISINMQPFTITQKNPYLACRCSNISQESGLIIIPSIKARAFPRAETPAALALHSQGCFPDKFCQVLAGESSPAISIRPASSLTQVTKTQSASAGRRDLKRACRTVSGLSTLPQGAFDTTVKFSIDKHTLELTAVDLSGSPLILPTSRPSARTSV